MLPVPGLWSGGQALPAVSCVPLALRPPVHGALGKLHPAPLLLAVPLLTVSTGPTTVPETWEVSEVSCRRFLGGHSWVLSPGLLIPPLVPLLQPVSCS